MDWKPHLIPCPIANTMDTFAPPVICHINAVSQFPETFISSKKKQNHWFIEKDRHECFVVIRWSILWINNEHLIKEEKIKLVQTESREILTSLGEAYPPFKLGDFIK